ncbi:MAG: YybS family protein [Synergistaceae bacterium]|nr:YybS family protein [Synergistaceae bacterium]
MSSLSALLFCSGSLVSSPIGTAALLFCPTPLALLGARESNRWMAAGLIGISAFLSLFFGPMFCFYFLMGEGILCFGLSLPLGKLEKGSESLLFCTAVSILSKVVFFTVMVNLTGKNPFVPDLEALNAALSRMSGTMLSQGRDAAFLEDSLKQMASLAPYMLPSLILLSSMFDSFFNYKLCEFLQRGRPRAFPALPPLGEWRFPKSLLWAFLFAFALPLLADTNDWPLGAMLEFNMKFLVNVFFFLQGFSLVWWWLLKRKVHLFLRLLAAGALFFPLLGVWSVALGVGDLCLDLRTRTLKRR